jgi:hypothetical protein
MISFGTATTMDHTTQNGCASPHLTGFFNGTAGTAGAATSTFAWNSDVGGERRDLPQRVRPRAPAHGAATPKTKL